VSYTGGPDAAFEMLSYEFGDCGATNCSPVSLTLTLDEEPGDTSYSLVCDDQVFWKVDRYHFSNRDHETVTNTTCVSPTACCIFTILDEDCQPFNTGLTSPFTKEEPGRFEVLYR